MKSLVLLTVYSDVLRGDKSLAKYFASWYDPVLVLEIMGRKKSFISICSHKKLHLGCLEVSQYGSDVKFS